jgi:transketolase
MLEGVPEMKAPRDLFFEELLKYAIEDEKVILLYGDVGGIFLDRWLEEVPLQCFNMMPAEQNMILVAAGLASQGFKPYCYTIIPFLIFRPLEMIRIYLSHDKLPIRLVGVGAGNSYDVEGITHWSQGDKEIIETLGGIQIWTLDDYNKECGKGVALSTYESDTPQYVRLGR